MTALQLLAWIAAAVLLQLTAGVAVALWRRRPGTVPVPAPAAQAGAGGPAPAWAGWRQFRVARRTYEDSAQTQCSFMLQPVDGEPLPPFRPGQYLTFQLPVASAAGGAERGTSPRCITRCYSISDAPDPAGYRITVKRVPSPPGRPDLPPGLSSNRFHDHVQVGDTLQVKAPAGGFFIDGDMALPAVFIAGGIGITPMMSMLGWCLAAQPQRTLHLYYGLRHPGEQSFRQALAKSAVTHVNFHLTVACSDPGPGDLPGRDYQHAGRIDLDLLRSTLPQGRHRFYVCGPPPMMASLLPALRSWGVPAEDIRYEAFGPASAPPAEPATVAPGAAAALPLDVRFLRAGRTLGWDGQDANLLDFAERQGVDVESGCRSGSCGSCETRLVSGTVSYAHPPDHAVAAGSCLLCVGVPTSALVLEA